MTKNQDTFKKKSGQVKKTTQQAGKVAYKSKPAKYIGDNIF